MLQKIISGIQLDLAGVLGEEQLQIVTQVVQKHLASLPIEEDSDAEEKRSDFLSLFIAAKRVEGCSEKSLRYYESTIRNMLEGIDKPERFITTEDLRGYLDTYQRRFQ